MMGSAHREPTGVGGLERRRRRLGFSPMPVLPIVPSVDHSHCSSRQEASLSYLEGFSRFVYAPGAPYGPDDAGDLVGQSDRCLIHSSALLHLESPRPQAVGMFQPLRSEHRSRAMDQERTQVDIALLADSSESTFVPCGFLLRSQAEETSEFPAGWEAQDFADKGDEGSGRNQSHTGNRHQALDYRHAGCQSAQLALDCFDAVLEIANLQAGLSQSQAQGIWDRAVGILDQGPDPGHDMVGTDRQGQAQLAQDAANGVDAGGAVADPGRTKPVQRRQGLLRDGLDRNGVDLFVAMGFEQALSVGAVSLVAPHIGLDVGGGQQQDLVAELSELSSPVMCHATSFKEDDGRLALCKEAQEPSSREPVIFSNLAGVVRHGDLKHVLCQIDSDRRRLSHGLLLSVCKATRQWYRVPASQEESIPSLKPSSVGRRGDNSAQ